MWFGERPNRKLESSFRLPVRDMSGRTLDLARCKWCLPQRSPEPMLEVDPLVLKDVGSCLDMREDVPYVLANDAQEEHLQRAQEKNADYERSDSHREFFPEQQLVNEIRQTGEKRNCCADESCERRESQWNFRQRR